MYKQATLNKQARKQIHKQINEVQSNKRFLIQYDDHSEINTTSYHLLMFLVQVLLVWPFDQASTKENKHRNKETKHKASKRLLNQYDDKERNATSYHFLIYLVQILFVWLFDQASKKTNKRSTKQQKDSSTKYDDKKRKKYNQLSFPDVFSSGFVRLAVWPKIPPLAQHGHQSVLNRARAPQ